MINYSELCQYEENFMMACLLGRVQVNFTLLLLRCANANLFMNFCHLGRGGKSHFRCFVTVDYAFGKSE